MRLHLPENPRIAARRITVFLCALCLIPSGMAQAGNPRRSPVVDVVERVRGAVVNIHSERTVQSNEDILHHGPNRVNGMGTGIIIDPRGYIVTNHHVVDDVQFLRVRLADGSSYPAKVYARD